MYDMNDPTSAGLNYHLYLATLPLGKLAYNNT